MLNSLSDGYHNKYMSGKSEALNLISKANMEKANLYLAMAAS